MKAGEYLRAIFKYFLNMPDAEEKDFTFSLELLRRKIKTRKIHPAMYILQQTCHFRHLSKCIWNMESNPTELLFGIAH